MTNTMLKNALLIALLALASTQAKAQLLGKPDGSFEAPALEPPRYKYFEFFIQPLPAFAGGFELGVEKGGDAGALRFTAGFYQAENGIYRNRVPARFVSNSYVDQASYEGLKFDLQYKYYLSQYMQSEGLGGTYVGLYANHRSLEVNYKTSQNIYDPGTGTYTIINGQVGKLASGAASFGVIIGVKLPIVRRLNVDAFGGVGMVVPTTGTDEDRTAAHIPVVNPYKGGPMLKFGLSIGLISFPKSQFAAK
jgi:hypothetical protein